MKKTILNRIVVVLFVFSSVLVLIACGSGGGDGGGSGEPPEPQVAPAISNLQYLPSSAALNQGGGAVTVNGTIDFIDPNGNVTTLLIGTNATDITGISGVNSGTVAVIVVADTTQAGSFPFKITVTDSTGLSSNELSGTFTVN